MTISIMPGYGTTPSVVENKNSRRVKEDNPATENNHDHDKDNSYQYAFDVLIDLLDVLTTEANSIYESMEQSTDRARNTQDMSNRMDEIIAEAAKGDDKTREKVPDEVAKYMRDNGISVDGVTIDDYISQHGGATGLDKGSLQAIKAALDNSASRDTDLMTQGQLKIQKISQSMNAVNTLITTLLSKWWDLRAQIAQKTY